MRGGSSIRQQKEATKEAMETDNLGSGSSSKVMNEEEPHLSGAYIRSLVKQLTSSRSKEPMSPKQPAAAHASSSSQNQQTQQPPPHKKQVRRRLHTSRPYQERLLNMAEARREIVTALKYHRAAMKQANEQQQQQLQQPEGGKEQHHHHQLACFEQEPKVKSRRNPRTYPSSSSSPNFYHHNHYVHNFSSSNPLPPPSCSFPWTSSPVAVVGAESLNFPLPNQPLGLNLNIQDFNNIDAATLVYHNNSPPNAYAAGEDEVADLQQQSGVPLPPPPAPAAGTSHHVLGDEEMAEMRSIGEQHQVEWNDTMNLVTSAWWFKFMKTLDLGPELKDASACHNHPSDHQLMEFPPWFNPADSDGGALAQHMDHYNCPQDYSHDPTLPCMDIGEIEGMEEEWWA